MTGDHSACNLKYITQFYVSPIFADIVQISLKMIVEICLSTKRQFYIPIIIRKFHKYNIFYQVFMITFRKDIYNTAIFCITRTVEHNYISLSTVGIHLHVSALQVGHLQVVTQKLVIQDVCLGEEISLFQYWMP